jgi:hypothetical protein
MEMELELYDLEWRSVLGTRYKPSYYYEDEVPVGPWRAKWDGPNERIETGRIKCYNKSIYIWSSSSPHLARARARASHVSVRSSYGVTPIMM